MENENRTIIREKQEELRDLFQHIREIKGELQDLWQKELDILNDKHE